ncbi:MAG: leucine-rich repeat domain-containing protein [Prevotella sp.]|nr:leucine-rich repeat domain-containing protein [Prevotella sp.]
MDSSVDIPEIIIVDDVTYNVKYIGDWAFAECSSLESISIPKSIESIGSYSFYYCTSLSTVTLVDGLKTIGSSAFWGCNSLDSICLPNTLLEIGWSSFKKSKLKKIVIGRNIQMIGDDAFALCRMSSVHISDIRAWCNINFKGGSSNPLYLSGKLF